MAIPLILWRKLSAVRSPERSALISPVTTAISSPFFTLSPSFTCISKLTDLSSMLNTLLNTPSPAIMPSCLHIRSACPFWYTGITQLVDISPLVISSSSAIRIYLSAFILKDTISFMSFSLLFYFIQNPLFIFQAKGIYIIVLAKVNKLCKILVIQ